MSLFSHWNTNWNWSSGRFQSSLFMVVCCLLLATNGLQMPEPSCMINANCDCYSLLQQQQSPPDILDECLCLSGCTDGPNNVFDACGADIDAINEIGNFLATVCIDAAIGDSASDDDVSECADGNRFFPQACRDTQSNDGRYSSDCAAATSEGACVDVTVDQTWPCSWQYITFDPTIWGLDPLCRATTEGDLLYIWSNTVDCDPRPFFGGEQTFATQTGCFCEDGSCQILGGCTFADLMCGRDQQGQDPCGQAFFESLGSCVDCSTCIYIPDGPNCADCNANCEQEMIAMADCFANDDSSESGEGSGPTNDGPPQCLLDSNCTCFIDNYQTNSFDDGSVLCDCLATCSQPDGPDGKSIIEQACETNPQAMALIRDQIDNRCNDDGNQGGPPLCLINAGCACFEDVRGQDGETQCNCLNSCQSLWETSCANDEAGLSTIQNYIANGCQDPNPPSTAVVTFDGDYNTIVGDRFDEFLRECTIQCLPVNCVNVEAGSIIVTLAGKVSEVADAVTAVAQGGNLPVPGFPSLAYRSHVIQAQPTQPGNGNGNSPTVPADNTDLDRNGSSKFFLATMFLVGLVFNM